MPAIDSSFLALPARGLAAAALELSPSTIYRKRQAWADMELKRA